MKKTLIILTGGTIGSVKKNGYKDSDALKTIPILLDKFRQSDSEFKNSEFEVISPLNILSEDVTIESWNKLVLALKEVEFEKYDGVIIANGTDTLAYTAAMLSIVLGSVKIPVVLVSSQFPIEDDRANGNENFKNAVYMIKKGIKPNVYAVYRNDDGISYIHLGRDLKQCENYTYDFNSSTMKALCEYQSFEANDEPYILDKIENLENTVLSIEPYVGIDYNSFNLEGKKIVLHRTYHSSTACQDEVIAFMDRCKEKDIVVILSPFYDDGLMCTSTMRIMQAGAYAMSSVTKEYSYAKAVVGISLFADDLVNFMKLEK